MPEQLLRSWRVPGRRGARSGISWGRPIMQPPPDRLLRYLNGSHINEAALVAILTDILKDFRNPFIHSVLAQQMLQSKDQALRLEIRLGALGGQPSGGPGFLRGLAGKVSSILHAPHDPYDRGTQDVIIQTAPAF